MSATLPDVVRQGGPQPVDPSRPPGPNADIVERILRDPRYHDLKADRSRFGWMLALAVMVVYYGFILLVAFGRDLLARPIGQGVTTLGMPIGLGVIIFTILITAVYVGRSNRVYDVLGAQIVDGAQR